MVKTEKVEKSVESKVKAEPKKAPTNTNKYEKLKNNKRKLNGVENKENDADSLPSNF